MREAARARDGLYCWLLTPTVLSRVRMRCQATPHCTASSFALLIHPYTSSDARVLSMCTTGLHATECSGALPERNVEHVLTELSASARAPARNC